MILTAEMREGARPAIQAPDFFILCFSGVASTAHHSNFLMLLNVQFLLHLQNCTALSNTAAENPFA